MLKKQITEGVIGTIIFHFIVAIIILLLKLSSIEEIDKEGFYIIFEEEETQKLLEQNNNESSNFGEENINRNIAINKNQQENNLSDEENLRRILSSMKSFNKSAENNLTNDESFKLNEDLQKKLKDRSMLDSSLLIQEEIKLKEKSSYFYEGPTNIYYSFNLGSRQHIYLHIPVYKCQGGGKVTLIFDINREGGVISSTFDRNETNTVDDCLLEAAKNSLSVTKFNPDSKATQYQTGTITYIFVRQ